MERARQTYRLEELSWPQAQAAIEAGAMAVLPVGSLEQHGRHLTINTDNVLGDALAAIPVALLFGGLSVGGRYIQGKLHMGFGVDYALLGVLMITLVAFQFFYRYKIVWVKTKEETLHVGVHRQMR